jgi:cell division protein FtsL
MNESPTTPAAEKSQDPVSALQHQLQSMLILTCVVSVTLTIFLGFQFYAIQRDVQALRAITVEHQTKTQPMLQELGRKLLEFSKTNPDIKPILDKYGVANPANPAAAGAKK